MTANHSVRKDNFRKGGLIPVLFVFLLLTGCAFVPIGNGPSVSIEKARKQLAELGYTPKDLRYIQGPPKYMPWVCICENKKKEEWGVVLHPSGKVEQVQLGTKEHLSREQMLKKLETLGYKRDEFMELNLHLMVSGDGTFYWSFPVDLEHGKYIRFNLAGEKINSDSK
ncbi:hypothetical protein [Effusibacillus consociatus]|uniref:Uncharacterized protein n=1 Tax=Effusibacillus consociatus TaxID=1117041 RepID=A0ABV9Q633_9BACL